MPFPRSAPFVGLLALLVFGWSPSPATAQAPAAAHDSGPVTTATRLTGSITLDGIPNEEAWKAAPAITELLQLEPDERQPVTERTEIRILFDDYNLYVGAWMYDRGPLVQRLGRRDSAWPDVDLFTILLDTYHDHRTAFRFSVNPSGTKRDEIVTGGGGGGGPGGGEPGSGTRAGTRSGTSRPR
jgi:hypothetical protein